jgi:hypothetical protein
MREAAIINRQRHSASRVGISETGIGRIFPRAMGLSLRDHLIDDFNCEDSRQFNLEIPSRRSESDSREIV